MNSTFSIDDNYVIITVVIICYHFIMVVMSVVIMFFVVMFVAMLVYFPVRVTPSPVCEMVITVIWFVIDCRQRATLPVFCGVGVIIVVVVCTARVIVAVVCTARAIVAVVCTARAIVIFARTASAVVIEEGGVDVGMVMVVGVISWLGRERLDGAIDCV